MKVGDLGPNRVAVGDHAVIRFLERNYGLDVESIRAAIAEATAHGRAAGALLGDEQFAVVVERIRFVVVSGRVVTSLGRDMPFCPKGYRRNRKARQ